MRVSILKPQLFKMQDGIRPVGNSSFAVYLADIVLDRADGKKKRLRDFLIAFPLQQQAYDVYLTLCKI